MSFNYLEVTDSNQRHKNAVERQKTRRRTTFQHNLNQVNGGAGRNGKTTTRMAKLYDFDRRTQFRATDKNNSLEV